MTRAVLSVGSNLGDRLAHLQSALDGLGPAVRAVSPVYETAPWGPVPQGDYLNVVVVVDDPAADEREWLRRAHALEQADGRTRSVRFGPRTLDVDLVTVADVRRDDPDLTLPHPRAHERAFVLVPWLAVEPAAVLADRGPIAALLTGLGPVEAAGVRRRDDLRLHVAADPGSLPAAGRAGSAQDGSGATGSAPAGSGRVTSSPPGSAAAGWGAAGPARAGSVVATGERS